MIDSVFDRMWAMGLWLRNRAKRASVLGSLEPLILHLAPRVIPAPKGETRIHLPGGVQMKVPAGYPSARSYAAGSYEPAVTKLFEDIVRPGMTVVDAGANVGYYTLLCASLIGAEGRVYAFEPDPLNYSYLVDNVTSNGFERVVTARTALSNETGNGKFIQDSHGAEGFLTTLADSRLGINVPTATLDDVFKAAGWPLVDIIKIDVEGGESGVLEGMRELTSRNQRMKLIMELNAAAISRSGNTRNSVAQLLCDLGFVKGSVIEADNRPFSVIEGLPPTRATYNLLLQRDASINGPRPC